MADPTDPTTPADSDFVKEAAAELRALKAYLTTDGGLHFVYALIGGYSGQAFDVSPGAGPNQAVNLGQFTLTGNADAGELVIPLIFNTGPVVTQFRIKWGKVLLATGSQTASGTVNFPAAFPNSCFWAGGFPDAPAQAAGWNPLATTIRSVVAASFGYICDTSGGADQPITNVVNLKWFAFGW